MPRIVSLTRARDGKKKWIATFDDGKKTKFGAFGSNDYTITGDKEARRLYRLRHKSDLDTNDPTRAGYLSWFLLWGDSTNISENLKAYNNRFG